jgi:hypothetical protein
MHKGAITHNAGVSDTHPAAARVQLDLLRRAGPIRRAALGAEMTTAAVAASRYAIQRLHPDWSELEVKLEWARVHYGEELASRVRAYLAARGRK